MKKLLVLATVEVEVFVADGEEVEETNIQDILDEEFSFSDFPPVEVIDVQVESESEVDDEEKASFADEDFCEFNPVFATDDFKAEVYDLQHPDEIDDEDEEDND